jgi:hypothetical protein
VQPEGSPYCFKVERRNVSAVCLEQTAKAYHIPSAWEARGSLRRAATMKLNGVVAPLFALGQFCDLCIAAQ